MSRPRASANHRLDRVRNRRSRRNAAATLEVILTLPLLMIVMLAIVEFGLLLANLQYVEMASRSGALVASRLPAATLNGGAFPTDITTAVNEELAKLGSGIQARQVYLQHNVGGSPVSPRAGGQSTSPIPYKTITDPPVPPSGSYVRVTVFVDFRSVAPNLLATFGLNYQNATVQQTTTFPHTLP